MIFLVLSLSIGSDFWLLLKSELYLKRKLKYSSRIVFAQFSANAHNFVLALLLSNDCIVMAFVVWALARMVTSAVKSGGDAQSILRLESGDVKGKPPAGPNGALRRPRRR